MEIGSWKLDLGVVTPRFFRTGTAFRSWLAKNGGKADELLVGFYKVGSGKGGLTYKQAVDEALCHGWIDGVRKGIDDHSYTIRFTPRKKGSIWSKVNITHVARLKKAGLMTAAGLAAYEKRTAQRSGVYAFENEAVAFSSALTSRFQAKKRAWAFWERQPPGYRKTCTWWVMSAKREETRERRIATVIEYSAGGERIPLMGSPYKKKGMGNGK